MEAFELHELSLEGFMKYPVYHKGWDPDSVGWGWDDFIYLSARERGGYGMFWVVPMEIISVASPATVHGNWKVKWHQAAVPIPPGYRGEDLIPVHPTLVGWRDFFADAGISIISSGNITIYRACRRFNGWEAVLEACTYDSGLRPEFSLLLRREDIPWLRKWGERLDPPAAEEILEFFGVDQRE